MESNEMNSSTVVTEQSAPASTSENITVTLHQPETDNSNNKKVAFSEGTVDNENLNRKKSKCCCIFEKQRLFGESSSEDDDDDCPDHCHGRKQYHKKPSHNHDKDHKCEKDSHNP